jgi:hypothetical protein
MAFFLVGKVKYAEKCMTGKKCVDLNIQVSQSRGSIEQIPGDSKVV